MALRTVKELEQGHFYSMKKPLLFLTMKPSILVGGQAVIEGVMIRVPGAYTTAVRDPKGKIQIQKKDFQSITERSKLWNKPVFRGMASLFKAMKMGMTTLQYSADIALPEKMYKAGLQISYPPFLPLYLPFYFSWFYPCGLQHIS